MPQFELQPFTKLAPAEYRRCPQCKTPVLLKQMEAVRPRGLKRLKFECRKCKHVEEIVTPTGMLGRLVFKTLSVLSASRR